MRKDFDTLERIKDIMEELSMLLHVAKQQRRAVRLLDREEVNPLAAGIYDKSSHRGSLNFGKPIMRRKTEGVALQVPARPATSPSLHRRRASDPQEGDVVIDDHSGDEKPVEKRSPSLMQLLQRAEERYLDFMELVNKARATYQALHDLLDLKQRQANLSEATQARRSANEMEVQSKRMQDQNNSIMLFTVVTILFLPLSSLASIFGINAVEFGQGHVTLARIFAYLFPISAFVVGVTFLLAFNHNIGRILQLWLKIGGIWLLRWFPTVSVNHYVEYLQTKVDDLQAAKSPGDSHKGPASVIPGTVRVPRTLPDAGQDEDTTHGSATSRTSTRQKVVDVESAESCIDNSNLALHVEKKLDSQPHTA